MYTKQQAKKLNMPMTIDLKAIYARKYLDSKKSKKDIIKEKIMKYLGIAGIIWFIIVTCVGWGVVTPPEVNAENTDNIHEEYKYYGVDNYRDYARKIRLETCERVYRENQDFVDNTFIHKSQDVVVRCATMMGLIGAYESGYFTSRRYVEDNNAFGIKDYKTGKFKIYNSTYEGQLDFAEKYLVGHGNNYFKGHKNRTIEQFVRNWSGDPIEVENRYIKFVSKRYWKMYKEVEKLYKL